MISMQMNRVHTLSHQDNDQSLHCISGLGMEISNAFISQCATCEWANIVSPMGMQMKCMGAFQSQIVVVKVSA